MRWIGFIIFGVLTVKCWSHRERKWAFMFGLLGLISMINVIWLVLTIVIAIVLDVWQRICWWSDDVIEVGCILLLSVGLIYGIVDLKMNPPPPDGIFPIGNSTVEEVRYDILGGNDTTMVNGGVSGYFFHGIGSVSGSISEESFYKIYYPGTNAEGENIAIPKTVKESETEVVLCPDDMQSEYLLETITTQQYMERKRGRNPKEQYFEDVLRKYKLYVRESTFNNKVVLDGK